MKEDGMELEIRKYVQEILHENPEDYDIDYDNSDSEYQKELDDIYKLIKLHNDLTKEGIKFNDLSTDEQCCLLNQCQTVRAKPMYKDE